jgi:hypothetical protein
MQIKNVAQLNFYFLFAFPVFHKTKTINTLFKLKPIQLIKHKSIQIL